MEPILFGNSFNEFEVLSIHSGLYTDILERQKNIMQHALQRHNKVMQVRFDLHYPADASISPSPDDISTFSYNFSRRLKRMRICSHRVDPHYIWVRELKESEYPHYHFMVWINASAIQNRYTILTLLLMFGVTFYRQIRKVSFSFVSMGKEIQDTIMASS